MHIAVDLDDVVLDFTGGLCSTIRKEYAYDLKPEDITAWDLHTVLDPIVGRSWWAWLRERDWLWATFPAIDGAIGSLDRLRREGHYLELVTSKPRWAESNVWKWLGLWRPPFNRVTIMDTDEASKADVTTADLLIDDKPANCRAFLDSGREALLFDRPHNRDADLLRAKDWNAVLGYVWLETGSQG